MVSKLFLDANLLLDFTLQRAGYPFAEAIIEQGIEGKVILFTTPAVIHITSYWLRKHYGRERNKTLIISMLDTINIIECDHLTAVAAVHSNIGDVDIEDALQYFTALKFGLNYFISSDKELKLVAFRQLPVMSAEEYLKITNSAS